MSIKDLAFGLGVSPMGCGRVNDVGWARESGGFVMHFGSSASTSGRESVVGGKELAEEEVVKHWTPSTAGADCERDEYPPRL